MGGRLMVVDTSWQQAPAVASAGSRRACCGKHSRGSLYITIILQQASNTIPCKLEHQEAVNDLSWPFGRQQNLVAFTLAIGTPNREAVDDLSWRCGRQRDLVALELWFAFE